MADFISISERTHHILGLDDPCRYTDIRREVTNVGRHTFYNCHGTRDALISLVTEINDRATEDETGYNESASDRRALRRTVERCKRNGFSPRD